MHISLNDIKYVPLFFPARTFWGLVEAENIFYEQTKNTP